MSWSQRVVILALAALMACLVGVGRASAVHNTGLFELDGDAYNDPAVAGAPTTIALAPPPPGTPVGAQQTGIILDSTDLEADHAALKDAGVDVDEEISRYGDPVPPMFWLRDPDGNSLCIVQPTS